MDPSLTQAVASTASHNISLRLTDVLVTYGVKKMKMATIILISGVMIVAAGLDSYNVRAVRGLYDPPVPIIKLSFSIIKLRQAVIPFNFTSPIITDHPLESSLSRSLGARYKAVNA